MASNRNQRLFDVGFLLATESERRVSARSGQRDVRLNQPLHAAIVNERSFQPTSREQFQTAMKKLRQRGS
jgi:hypothetical protein